eukprot:2658143-Rhodomonas_salina.1
MKYETQLEMLRLISRYAPKSKAKFQSRTQRQNTQFKSRTVAHCTWSRNFVLAICLRACCAMSGTELAYDVTEPALLAMRCPVLR